MPRIFQVVEYQTVCIGEQQGEVCFERRHWDQLFRFHDEHEGHRYFEMRHDAVRFGHHVGVIQVGDLTLEILPKVDDVPTDAPHLRRWRNILLYMLREAGTLKLESLSNANLRERPNSLLDLYLDVFLVEVEKLLHQGLVKRYRHTSGQQQALRGALQFGQHITHNLVHQERFYTRHQTYDHQHLPNQLLRQALVLLPRLTTDMTLRGRSVRALLHWAEVPGLRVTAATFSHLRYDRKTERYRPALVIARLLLLHHRPDLRGGSEDLIALLFDMNRLWEQYLLRTIQRLASPRGWTVTKPQSKRFWETSVDYHTMQPDLLLTRSDGTKVVLDAKWKRPAGGKPADADLRQLYAYAHYYGARDGALVYPATDDITSISGTYSLPHHFPPHFMNESLSCGLHFIQVGNGGGDDLDEEGFLHCSLKELLIAYEAPIGGAATAFGSQ